MEELWGMAALLAIHVNVVVFPFTVLFSFSFFFFFFFVSFKVAHISREESVASGPCGPLSWRKNPFRPGRRAGADANFASNTYCR